MHNIHKKEKLATFNPISNVYGLFFFHEEIRSQNHQHGMPVEKEQSLYIIHVLLKLINYHLSGSVISKLVTVNSR